MFLRYFYNEKLAHASYMVGCQATGEALVIDPGRDIGPYLQVAEEQELKITAATETHIHADFVSGARELAERVGAKLYLSDEGDENWKYQYLDGYDHQLLKDGDSFMIGNIRLEVMHTPGHTPEHISFILTDTPSSDRPMGIFTGDFVFVGSAGRPDLLEKAAKIENTADKGARDMFHSIQRFKQLPDFLQVWPAHGAGSACGKGLGAVPSSTIGYEKISNPALAYEDEDEFVEMLLAGQPEPPKYFAVMKRVNKEGPAVLNGFEIPPLMPEQKLAETAENALVVDTRPHEAFANGHVPKTINIAHQSDFTTWAGWLVDYEEPFYLIAPSERVLDVVKDLASIGLDKVAGYFEDAAVKNYAGLQRYEIANAKDLAAKVLDNSLAVLDIRGLTEWEEGHIPGATHIMLGYLPERVQDVPNGGRPVVVQCRTGNRSAIAASILQAKGIEQVINMRGGLKEWEEAGLPVSTE